MFEIITEFFSKNNLMEEIASFNSVWLPKIIKAVVVLIIGLILIKIIRKILQRIFSKDMGDKSLRVFIKNILNLSLGAVLFVIILAVFGVNVSGLIAGLGIAGLVIGFALKDTLGNLVSGLFILFHKPFKVNDWIKIGDIVGGVEKIGMAACTLKSPDGVKITIPNSRIWGDVIQNLTGNPVRKIFSLNVGISYSDDIGKAIKIIKTILKKDKRVLKDPAPQVVVKDLGDSSVNIGVRPSVKKEDYWDVYFDTIKAIKEEFDKKGITIPFPQTTIWMNQGKTKKKK